MAELFRDDFARADSATLGGNWVEVTGNFDIVSGGIRATPPTQSLAINTTSLGGANYKVTANISTGSMWSSTGGLGVVARYVDANNYYFAWLDVNAPHVKLYRVVGGTFTSIGDAIPGSPPADPTTLTLGCLGSSLFAIVNDVQCITITDTSLSAAGNFGVRAWDGSTFTDHLVNSVVVEDLVTEIEVLPENGLTSTLNGAITATATTVVIQGADAANWPTVGNYRAVLWQDPVSGPWELVKVVSGQGSASLGVQRAAEPYYGNQTARAWPSGTGIAAVLTQDNLDKHLYVRIATQEFLPSGGTTGVVLTDQPETIIMVARSGVVQSLAAGHYSVIGSALTFAATFSGSERVIVSYSVRGAP